jgi:energy-coupling factor transport system ATP-binding protein
MIEIRDMTYGYNEEKKVIQNVSFSLRNGEILAIAGRNGTGKTTITRLVMGLLKPEQGTVFFDGRDVTQSPAAERSAVIGYVFQNPDSQIFANTVLEEAMYSPLQHGYSGKQAEEKARKALREVALLEFAERSPQLLSRGQKQRLAIASALAAEPEVLILDEPTSGQDCRERVQLLRLMRKLNEEGMSILLVTHDMDILAEHATRMLVLEQGHIGFEGKPAELFSDKEKTEALGLELPEAVRVSAELGLPICLTPAEIYAKLVRRTGTHA